MSQINQLLRLHRQGCKIKEISRMLELSRNTVKRYLQKVEAAGWSIEALLTPDDPELQKRFHPGLPAYRGVARS